jgi:hypothetical protein
MWRELLAVTRNPADVAGRMLIFAWIAVLTGGWQTVLRVPHRVRISGVG